MQFQRGATMIKIGITAVLFILLTSVASVQAQVSTTPQVDISCSPSELTFDVYPGATNITAETICTIANPTAYEEKIELNESHGDAEISVEFAGGNVVVVPAGGEVNVTITITASEGAESASHNLEITATVIELNGTPPPSVASDSDDILVTFNAYDDYTIVCDDPLVISINSEYQHPNKFDSFLISNNGNYNTMLKLITTDLDEILAPYNLSLSVSGSAFSDIASNESKQLNFMLGDLGEWYDVNKTSWEVLDNGTKILYINSTVLFETVHPPPICLQCNQTIDLNFEIYYVQIESNSGAEETTDEEDKAVPGFELSIGILSIVCAVMIANRKLGRIE